MDKEKFRRKYEAKIRPCVDWDLFEHGTTGVHEVTLQLPDDLGVLWTPWYRGGSAGPPPEMPHAEPMSVLDAAARLHELGHNAPGVHRHVAEHDTEPFGAPALQISRGRYLLLDKNHHTVAAAVLGTRVRAELAVVSVAPGTRLIRDLPPLS